ncbi:hypothetical protein ABV409_14880 [Flagellimonas sp. DF-77]|uniref:hypothetical protein n=1 Tax=Flagellimonas algarum TaxID=3230298 RepID=UPI0033987C3E
MRNSIGCIIIFLVLAAQAKAQTNNLTGSPYSFFGLGLASNSNIGITNAMGNGGYALSGDGFINNNNPASYGSLGERNFLFDFGFLAEISDISTNSTSENRIAGSFSNVAFAASMTPNSAFGISLNPFSDVGYAVIGVESNIEGSFDTFSSNVFGSGGLNDLRLSLGSEWFGKLRTGAYLSYLFGVIEEREIIDASQDLPNESTLIVQERNFYNGLRVGFGLQYDLLPKLTLAAGAELNTSLSGTQDRTVEKTLDFTPSVVENTADVTLEDFELPAQLNAGLYFRPNNGLGLTLDFSKRFWDITEQEDNIGDFVDEESYSIGLHYAADPSSYQYRKRIQYRLGWNYRSGNLEVNANRIDQYGFSFGIGLPMGLRSASTLNITYRYGQRGAAEGVLVEERLHTLTVNFSLRDLWFGKRKIN